MKSVIQPEVMSRYDLNTICARLGVSIPGLSRLIDCKDQTIYGMIEGSASAVMTDHAIRYLDKYGDEGDTLSATALRKVMTMREMSIYFGKREKLVYDAMNRRRPISKRLSMACRWYMLEVKPKKHFGEVKRPVE